MALDFIQYINENWNVTAALKTAMLDDFCSQYGYQEEIDGEPNPVSKKEFANSKIIKYIKDTIDAYRKGVAEAAVEYDELDGDFV